MHVAMFFAGFAVAFAQNWRLTIVLISIGEHLERMSQMFKAQAES